jgi:hypothetical protein
MRRAAAVTFVCICFAALGAARAGPGRHALGISPLRKIRERRVYILDAGQTRLDLGRSFIIPGSDSLVLGGEPLLRGDAYRINTLRGVVTLAAAASGGDTLFVSFARHPFPFSPVFASRFPEGRPAFPARLVTTAEESRGARPSGDPYRLRLSGSKSVGFSVGTGRGLGIDQSLKVSMVGTVAKDLEVEAYLTDDNLPVQPEGNTEELKYLDKVAVEIRSRHAKVQLGDFSTGQDWSRFSAFQRELRGAMATVDVKGQTYFAGGGIAKGRFRTATFRGREGVQGPYELLPARRFNGVIVLPGTESVYLDGRLLKRGGENDYTIDYNRGSVTFTERLPVTDDSEIVIDFQIGEDDYERTTVSAGWEAPFRDEALTVRAFFFQESDNADRPLRGGLSDEERSLIAGAGDDPAEAVADGIEQVEPGKGDYVLVPADSLPARFVFVESGGDYELDFYEVGPGAGDYRTDGFSTRGEVKYAYAGQGQGNYMIGRPLPLPERRRLFTVGARGKRGSLFLDMEGDVSLRDENLLSGLDDDDNAGHAIHVTGGVRELPVSSSTLSLFGEYSILEDRFAAPDKPRDSYFYRNWNLEDAPLVGSEQIGGASLAWRGAEKWEVTGDYRLLARGSGLSARKGDLSARVGDMAARGISMSAVTSETGGDRDRRFIGGEGVLALWRLVPRVSFETERYRAFNESAPDTGRLYYQGALALGARNVGDFKGSASYSIRRTDHLADRGGEWFRARDNNEVRFTGGYSSGGRIVDLDLTHRRSRDAGLLETSWYNLARFRYRDAWEAAAMTTDIGYRISAGEQRSLEKAVIFVGENQGDYDVEGREVGQKRGDYMVVYLPGGEKEAVNTVELTWRLSIGGGLRGVVGGDTEDGWISRLRRNVSCDHFFSVIEKSRTDDLARLYALSPSLLQRDGVTLYGMTNLRQEWSFLNDVKRYNLRLTFSREDEEDNRSEGVPVERFSEEVQVRAEAVPTPALTVSLELAAKLRERDSGGLSGQNYRVRSRVARQQLSYRISPSTRLSVELGYEDRDDEVSLARQSSYSATPTFTSSVGAKLHVTAFVKFTYTNVESDFGKPLFFLEEGLREDWSAIGQYRITRNVSFGVNYTGRREKDFLGEIETVHSLKMESRAYF